MCSQFRASDYTDKKQSAQKMRTLFEHAYQHLTKIDTTPSPQLNALVSDMAQYIPTTTEYTFTFLNSDTHSLTLTYAPNQVGTPAFIHECKQQLAILTGHPVATLGILKHDDNHLRYSVIVGEIPPMVALGDVCDIKNGERYYDRNPDGGVIPVYSCRKNPLPYTTDKPNRTGKSLVIPRTSVTPEGIVRILNGPIFLNDLAFTLDTKNEAILLPDYLNCVLLAMRDDLFDAVVAREVLSIATLSNLNIHKFKAFEIPLPSLDTQHQLVQEFQTIDAGIQAIDEHIKCEKQRIWDVQQLKTVLVASFCGVG
jgi:hypothetical protein